MARCEYCDRIFVDSKALDQHKLHKHGDLFSDTIRVPSSSPHSKKVDSSEQRRGSSSSESSEVSVVSQDIDVFAKKCKICSRIFVDAEALQQHCVNKHSDKNVRPHNNFSTQKPTSPNSGKYPHRSSDNTHRVDYGHSKQPSERSVPSKDFSDIRVPKGHNPTQYSHKDRRRHSIDIGGDVDIRVNHQTVKPSSRSPPILALDCEFVGVRVPGIANEVNGLARVGIVDENCRVLYSSYCNPEYEILDYRTAYSGVRAADVESAPSFHIVQKIVRSLIQGSILVGHDISHDLDALQVGSRELFRVIDTAIIPEYQ
eukprot:gene8737-10358_t